MKALESRLLTFLYAPQQLHIPIYQRTYSWLATECDQLWNDVVRAGQDPETATHFMGAVVYLAPGAAPLATEPVERLVIDGQQRITTLTLLLLALRDVLESQIASGQQPQVSPDQIHQQSLTNQFAKPDKQPKLLLTGKDHATLQLILNRMALEATPTSPLSDNVVKNYQRFRAKIESGEVSPEQLFDGIQKLMIVEVSLEKGVDDPQLIFESLNSTGRDLSQADLIRNFVLMRLSPDDQKQLYLEHWQPMEQSFLNQENGELHDYYTRWFDLFVRDYLTLTSESGAIPIIRGVYDAFKEYARKKAMAAPVLVADLHYFSSFYTRLRLDNRETDPDLMEHFRNINAIEVDVAYPFLMRVLADYENQTLDKATLLRILTAVESYVFRRSVCGIPPNSLNKTFATLYRNSGRLSTDNYAHDVENTLCALKSNYRFPDDDEFRREIEFKNLYQTRTCNYLLRKLENFGTTEKIVLPNLKITVEHILPQNENLSDEWRTMLGDDWQHVQNRWLHTLGNLTLSGYNSSLSDRPFTEKRDLEMDGQKVGLGSGRFQLNQSVKDRLVWDEDAICERAATLSQRALKVWPYPALTSSP